MAGRRAWRGDAAHRGIQISRVEFRALWDDPALTLAQIGERLGITKQAVTNRARARGFPPRPRDARADVRKVDPVVAADMYRAGVPLDQIMAHFGCTWVPLRRALAQADNLRRRGRGKQAGGITIEQYLAGLGAAVAVRDRRITDMWAAGVRLADIAAHTGLRQQALRRRIRWMGLPARAPGYYAGITLAQWAEMQLGQRMTQVAAAERAALRARQAALSGEDAGGLGVAA